MFVDIGQGDGCLMITPDDKLFVIDAGAGDNMLRFLRWRFRGFGKRLDFEAAIISHSDLDHYGGFEGLFDEPNLFFKNIYTNGFMERKAASDTEILGPRVSHNGAEFITSLVPDLVSLDDVPVTSANFKGKKYPDHAQGGARRGEVHQFQDAVGERRLRPGFRARSRTKSSSSSSGRFRKMPAA